MRERTIEQVLIDQVEANGGLCLKWVSPGQRGVPDRLVCFQGEIYPVELKAPGESPRPSQVYFHQKLLNCQIQVFVLDSMDAVHRFIEEILDGKWFDRPHIKEDSTIRPLVLKWNNEMRKR